MRRARHAALGAVLFILAFAAPAAANGSAVSVSDTAVAEGDEGATTAAFTVSLSQPADQDVTVGFFTAPGTAQAPDDYATTFGSLTFAAGSTQRTIAVPVRGDVVDEPDEQFSVVLHSPAGATLARDTATGTILDDDRNGHFTCQGTGVRTALLVAFEDVVMNRGTGPCRDTAGLQSHVRLRIGPFSVLSDGLDVLTQVEPDSPAADPAPGDHGRAESTVDELVISGLPAGPLRVTNLRAQARSRCEAGKGAPVLGGSSSAGTIEYGTQPPRLVGDAPMSISFGSRGVLHLNHQTVLAGELIQRALWLQTSEGDVVAGEARAGHAGNPCSV